jgi:membrane protein
MTSRSAEPAAPTAASPNRLQRLQARVAVIDRRVRRFSVVQALLTILDTYNAAGGGLTAGGLAYGALFAVVPGLLLVVSLLVIVVDSATTRQQMIDWLVTQVPPLEAFASEIVTGLAKSAAVGTVIGLVGFIWGASGFYLGLEGAMERLFPGPKRRDPLIGRIRGMIAVAIVVGAVLAAFLVNWTISILWAVFGTDLGELLPLVSPVVAIVVSSAVALTVYVLVPSDTPGWRAAFPPAVLAGVAIGLLTSLYGLVAPLLLGGFAGLGVIASVFAALIWFNWVFQFLLYGGAWARLRRDRRYAKGVVR